MEMQSIGCSVQTFCYGSVSHCLWKSVLMLLLRVSWQVSQNQPYLTSSLPPQKKIK